jgi:predicted PhzF superfamily epimerase YddE/YHI9
MNVFKLAAFSHNGRGGNPAGVAFYDGAMPKDEEMLRIAKEVGYSETAFLVKQDDAGACVILRPRWRSHFAGMPPSHWARRSVKDLAKVNTS